MAIPQSFAPVHPMLTPRKERIPQTIYNARMRVRELIGDGKGEIGSGDLFVSPAAKLKLIELELSHTLEDMDKEGLC